MPPAWVKDESIWEKAKKAFKKSYGKEPSTDKDWAIVVTIYKKMGGKVNNMNKVMQDELKISKNMIDKGAVNMNKIKLQELKDLEIFFDYDADDYEADMDQINDAIADTIRDMPNVRVFFNEPVGESGIVYVTWENYGNGVKFYFWATPDTDRQYVELTAKEFVDTFETKLLMKITASKDRKNDIKMVEMPMMPMTPMMDEYILEWVKAHWPEPEEDYIPDFNRFAQEIADKFGISLDQAWEYIYFVSEEFMMRASRKVNAQSDSEQRLMDMYLFKLNAMKNDLEELYRKAGSVAMGSVVESLIGGLLSRIEEEIETVKMNR